MRIERIHVEGFGRLHQVDTGPTPLEGLVVVLGPNEAGKSTLFTFLTTALYGFQPATRERNPHVPWGADQAAGRVRLRLEDGGCAEVERRLRSTPSARLTVHGSVTELNNRPLPWVEHVPRTVFRQVFAITLGELAALDGETWARIQDNVVGSMGASDLASARAVAEVLEREAGEIWRPTRRGNQKLRDLQARIRDARVRRFAAYERDGRIRELTDEIERERTQLLRAREERQRERLGLERAQSLVPIRQRADRIASLRAEGGERSELEGLPADPVERLATLRAERSSLQARRAELVAEQTEHAEAVAAYGERARDLVAHRDRIADLVARAATLGAERARVAELESDLARIDAEERSARERSAARDSPPPGADRGDAGGRRSERDGAAGMAAALGALGLGSALLAWGVVAEIVAVAAAGAALAAVGVSLGLARRASRRVDSASEADARAARRAEERERLRALGRAREQRADALAAARARIGEIERAAGSLRAALAGGDPAAGPESTARGGGAPAHEEPTLEAWARTLDEALRSAERLAGAAASAERDARRTSREVERVDTSLAELRDALTELEERGAALAAGDAARGMERARARLAAHRKADELQEDLERAHPDWRERAGDSSPGDLEPARRRARVEEIEAEIERLVRRGESAGAELARLRELETVDAVDGEIASDRETEALMVRERDRKWVLAKLLREADRRFREEHQPDLLRRASGYLAHLTGGRYDRLLVDETSPGHLFHVVGPGLPTPVALTEPISTGTLEQAYLSLRLAIVDHLDRGGERLPLFVDEVLVNWDAERRARGLEVLAGLSEQRQVFVFTCHPSVADELSARGARVLPLGPRG